MESSTPTGFDRFGLHDVLMRGLRSAGFTSPRPIQLDTISASLEGRDVLGLAPTGTGKTAAFALPMLHRIVTAQRKGPRGIVIAPTRELASQIAEEIGSLSRHTRVKTVVIFGGVSSRAQISALRKGAEIIVGCPGRILDLVQQGQLKLDRIETLVLDEADHMFDMGFIPTIRKILAQLPKRRQNLLFSATMPKEIRRLADELLNDPHVAELANSAPAKTIDHALYSVHEKRKRPLLERMLADGKGSSAIVFTRTKHRAKRLADQLRKAGHEATALQGNMSQGQRERAMKGFRDGRFDILVATDIAARGIDVADVGHVINYDVPTTSEAYTHRIGRTGRSARDGIASTFVTSDDRAWIKATEKMIGAAIERREVDGFDALTAPESSGDSRPSTPARGRAQQQRKGPRAKPQKSAKPQKKASTQQRRRRRATNRLGGRA